MKTKLLSITAVLLALAGGLFAWSWLRAAPAQAAVAAALPALPDLSDAPEPLRARIAGALERARSRFHARDGLAELSRLYHANGFLDEAVRCYAGLEQLEPAEPRWPHLHATIVAGYGESGTALTLWRKTVQLAPDYVPARLRLGDCLLKDNQPAEAAAAYDAVLAQEARNPYAALGLARLDLEAKRFDQARTRLESLVRQTNYQLGYDLIVSLYERLGLHERAETIRGMNKASGAYRDPPDPWLDGLIEDCYDSYRLAMVAGFTSRAGDPTKARRLLERAVTIAPTDVSAQFQLGLLCSEQGDFAAAREHLERCNQLAPDFADAYAHLSELQAKSGDPAGAERTLATGLTKCPQSPGLHLLRARKLKAEGHVDEAINEYMVSIRYRPNEPDAYIELGNTFISLGYDDKGVEQMRLALETDPANPMALAIVAFHAIQTGDESAAHQWLARVEAQPRISDDYSLRLFEAYRNKFGRDWKP
jgi:tetratricopeptide (TPR) repeat protein